MTNNLPNLKALGLEKEYNEEFSNFNKTDLMLLIESSYFENPHITSRPDEANYCEIEVIDCNDIFWYKNLIGFKFFCQIIYTNYGRGNTITEFKGVKLTDRKMIIFRSFSPEHVVIV